MFFLIGSFLTLTTLPIHGTVANSSEVAFIIQTPVSCDTVSHGTESFIRFANITVADSVGYPEVPMITCFVAVPDGVDPGLEWSVTGEVEHSDFPVYPAPAYVISYVYTQQVVEEFRQGGAMGPVDESPLTERFDEPVGNHVLRCRDPGLVHSKFAQHRGEPEFFPGLERNELGA